MMTVDDLPNEILCDIFSLAIQRSRAAPQIFKSGDDFRDCAALIEISRVCRRWREAALADSLIWSSFCIILDKPTAESLRQATRYASICFGRSRDTPLTFFVSISELDDLRISHPLMLELVAHEERWSRIAISITRAPDALRSLKAAEEIDRQFAVCVKNAGRRLLREFHFNLASWFTYSMNDPLPSLETLKIADYKLNERLHTLPMWLPLAQNLVELDITNDKAVFSFFCLSQMKRRKGVPAENHVFLLPKLKTLRAPPDFFSRLTCPALERYTMGYLPLSQTPLNCFQGFIERSVPPLHTLDVKNAYITLADFETARGYFIPEITTLTATPSIFIFFETLTEKSPEGDFPLLLPSLETLQLFKCNGELIPFISSLTTSRWGVASPGRSLKSVKLTQWSGSIPKFLSIKPSSRIQLKKVNLKWREIAQCVKEGLQLSIERDA
ncbi:hypothetical protein SCHPADRAFT_741520 [Schizopora paradoxa]|uniref:F-box domain-containing protein n=1 Tax=Schizopora paradoxa TaxID=27342 RepID=A0A0H2RJK2_9AGAM|nr:hypothetical protein SCHPADRAFT_741520 [Schizopora paradoxa]